MRSSPDVRVQPSTGLACGDLEQLPVFTSQQNLGFRQGLSALFGRSLTRVGQLPCLSPSFFSLHAPKVLADAGIARQGTHGTAYVWRMQSTRFRNAIARDGERDHEAIGRGSDARANAGECGPGPPRTPSEGRWPRSILTCICSRLCLPLAPVLDLVSVVLDCTGTPQPLYMDGHRKPWSNRRPHPIAPSSSRH